MVAYKAGSVLGFTLVGLAVLVLVILMIAYRLTYLNPDPTLISWVDY